MYDPVKHVHTIAAFTYLHENKTCQFMANTKLHNKATGPQHDRIRQAGTVRSDDDVSGRKKAEIIRLREFSR